MRRLSLHKWEVVELKHWVGTEMTQSIFIKQINTFKKYTQQYYISNVIFNYSCKNNKTMLKRSNIAGRQSLYRSK